MAGAIAIAWLAMWRTAYRLRPPLLSLGVGRRNADYLLISWRDLASAVAALALLWCVELWTGRNDFGRALEEIGLKAGAPIDQLAVLSVLLFAVCYAINLGFGMLRRLVGRRPTVTVVNMVPDSPGETAVFSLVLAPVSGAAEEIIFRGALQWAFIAATGDPISAIGSQAVLFGIIHLYQGGFGVLRTLAIGVVLGAGTLACGSLLPAIVAHMLINAAVGTARASTGTQASKT